MARCGGRIITGIIITTTGVLFKKAEAAAWFRSLRDRIVASFEDLEDRYGSGTPGRFKPPVPGYRQTLPPGQLAMLEHMRQASAVGGPEKVRADIARFVERTGADEIIVSSAIYDPAKRRRSLEITVRALA